MFKVECEWLADALTRLDATDMSPVLNVGSSTQAYNDKVQPWVNRVLLDPLRRRGIEVFNFDRQSAEGVDIVGDILNDADYEKIRGCDFGAVLCCNVLEHVESPAELARRCAAVVRGGGYIVVTVPYSYPRHSDPFDNLFRPTPQKVHELFPNTECICNQIIDVKKSYRDTVRRRPWIILRHIVRFPFPFINFQKWRHSMKKLQWLVFNYRTTAIIIKKL